MKIKEIKFGNTIYVFGEGQESWPRFEAMGEIGEDEDAKLAAKELKDFVMEQLKDCMPVYSTPSKQKPKMDIIALKQYQRAIVEGDNATIGRLKTQYHVEP